MGLLDKLKQQNHTGVVIRGDTMAALTDEGKRVLDQMMLQGRQHKILAELEQFSPQSISSITNRSGLSFSNVKTEIARLSRGNYIKLFRYDNYVE